jgi:hypothetical protein
MKKPQRSSPGHRVMTGYTYVVRELEDKMLSYDCKLCNASSLDRQDAIKHMLLHRRINHDAT